MSVQVCGIQHPSDQQLADLSPCTVHHLVDLENTPGLISVLAGKPNGSTFPIMSITMEVSSPGFSTNGELETIPLDEKSLALGLQYGTTAGQTSLLNLLVEMQCQLHGVTKDSSWRLSLGCGGTDLLYQALKTLTDPGDVVLVEVSSPTFRWQTTSLIHGIVLWTDIRHQHMLESSL